MRKLAAQDLQSLPEVYFYTRSQTRHSGTRYAMPMKKLTKHRRYNADPW